jgi:acyl-CoA synthetase (NDP forming)
MDRPESLEAFFNPRNIAVVGASNKEGKMGNLFVRRLLANFPGETFLVHPNEEKILGISTYPNIDAIPEPVDLVIPLIPQEQLLAMVKGYDKGKVKFLLAIPSGFGEVSKPGKLLEQELIRSAHERDTRVIGPNSMGMLNCPYGLNASMVPEQPSGGAGYSCITQSGGFGMAMYMYAQNHQLQMAKICDIGNTADVQVHEILDYFSQDEDTKIVGLFLESVPDQEKFLNSVRNLKSRKPVILTKLGRTPSGIRASFAHLGIGPNSFQMPEIEWGNKIIPAKTGLEMLHIAKALSWQPLPRGRKVGIITGSGGIGVEIADFCEEHGLEVPEFSSQLQQSLRAYLPSYASVRNPVDLTPLWWDYPKIYPPLIRTLFNSAEINLLIVTIIDVAATVEQLPYALIETNKKSLRNDPSAKPIYIYWGSTHSMLKNMRILEEGHIPCYQSTLETVRVATAICNYATYSAERG